MALATSLLLIFLLPFTAAFFFDTESSIPLHAHFFFSGELYCNKEQFDYHMTIYEKDFFSFTDDLIGWPAPVKSTAPHKYSAEAADTTDGCVSDFDWFGEFWCDHTFEIFMKIVHNCTPDGSNKKAHVEIGSLYGERGQEVHHVQNINLTDAGRPTTDVIDFTRS